MSFDLILPFLRPIEPLLLDESVSEIMGNPDARWWYERDGIVSPETTTHLINAFGLRSLRVLLRDWRQPDHQQGWSERESVDSTPGSTPAIT
jgi:hypothetical protein